jgi:hypothetical protein
MPAPGAPREPHSPDRYPRIRANITTSAAIVTMIEHTLTRF